MSPQQLRAARFLRQRMPCPVIRHSMVGMQHGQHNCVCVGGLRRERKVCVCVVRGCLGRKLYQLVCVNSQCTDTTHMETEGSTVAMICQTEYRGCPIPECFTPVCVSLVFLELFQVL